MSEEVPATLSDYTYAFRSFWKDGAPISPDFRRILTLSAGEKSDLDWPEIEKVEDGVVFELDFNWVVDGFRLWDDALFQTRLLAIKEFSRKIYSHFGSQTLGVVVYRGPLILPSYFPEEAFELHFQEWLEDTMGSVSLSPQFLDRKREIFAATVLSDYLHTLIATLPDGLPPLVFFEEAGVSKSHLSQLLSKSRFEHLVVNPHPVEECSRGLVLPGDALWTEEVEGVFEHVLKEEENPFRIVSEALMTEEWDSLETLVVIEEALSERGRRGLRGFAAAGGKIEKVNRSGKI